MKKIYLTVLIVFISITFSLYLTEEYINNKLRKSYRNLLRIFLFSGYSKNLNEIIESKINNEIKKIKKLVL